MFTSSERINTNRYYRFINPWYSFISVKKIITQNIRFPGFVPVYIQTRLHLKTTIHSRLFLLLPVVLFCIIADAQPVTGVWKGKIKSTKVELKLIKKGDSLVGTSYYYESKNNYRRYTVKGYFDDATNNVVWWDDVLVEDKSSHAGQHPIMAVTDFNCPGEGVMKLDGNTSLRDNKDTNKVPISLQKEGSAIFEDEWDFVLRNYVRGANHPDIIDSVAMLAGKPVPVPQGYEEAPLSTVAINQPVSIEQTKPAMDAGPIKETTKKDFGIPLTVEQKFSNRTKTLRTIIPITGDSIELRFYDNAEIDGDSIALFLNNRLLLQHIGLTDQAYTVKIAVDALESDNELVMVAENLGSIPPNTSLMVVLVGDKRYEARLQSSEGSSALVRFVKETKLK
jgi:hypothetical protein